MFQHLFIYTYTQFIGHPIFNNLGKLTILILFKIIEDEKEIVSSCKKPKKYLSIRGSKPSLCPRTWENSQIFITSGTSSGWMPLEDLIPEGRTHNRERVLLWQKVSTNKYADSFLINTATAWAIKKKGGGGSNPVSSPPFHPVSYLGNLVCHLETTVKLPPNLGCLLVRIVQLHKRRTKSLAAIQQQ